MRELRLRHKIVTVTHLSRRRHLKILADDLKTKHELFSTFKQLLRTSTSDLLYSSGFQSQVLFTVFTFFLAEIS